MDHHQVIRLQDSLVSRSDDSAVVKILKLKLGLDKNVVLEEASSIAATGATVVVVTDAVLLESFVEPWSFVEGS